MESKKNEPCISWERIGFIACFLISVFCLVLAVRPLSSVSRGILVSSAPYMLFSFVFLVMGLAFFRDWWKKHLNNQ